MTGAVYPVPAEWAANARLDAADAHAMRAAARGDPDVFWAEQARRLDWIAAPTLAGDCSFHEADFRIRWYADGVLNASAECVDRHLEKQPDTVAILWEGDDASEQRRITYAELGREVRRFANVLKAHGVARGDRVTIYLPMIPEAAYAMLACARIGAVHSVVFGGFSPDAIAGRITDCGSRLVVTADEGRRAGKVVPLKANVDAALANLPEVETVLVIARTGAPYLVDDVPMRPGRDFAYADEAARVTDDCLPEPMNAEDPLFILYTSGSTGKPKGVMHTTGGYLVYATLTHEVVFDHRPGQIFWCTADVGWVTGHSYVVYGPLANGGTTLMFEGVPTWPTPGRMWEIVDRHAVHTLFTAPTAIRALMREGDAPVRATSRASLRLLGTVGEPINPQAWTWYHEVVGEGRCPIVDTWWQTETGAAMITPLPGADALKPGSAGRPFPGVCAEIVNADGRVLDGEAEGLLLLSQSWPGQMRGVWNDPNRFFQTYFTAYPGKYFTGDGARRDADGDYWITGRVDDVINVSGHRMGTAEVESALVAHPKVAEAAVVGMPHDIKGQGIYAYVTVNVGEAADDALRAELVRWVRARIGSLAAPDALQFAPGLPKTRSGKIMRRILRKIAEGDTSNLGDTSTLADPAVVDDLLANRVAAAR